MPASALSTRASERSVGPIQRKTTSVAPFALPCRCVTRNRQVRFWPLYGSIAVYGTSGRSR